MTKLQEFINKWNGKYLEASDPTNKIFIINSKKHGRFNVLLDNEDYKKVVSLGKWNIHVVRGKPYVQKRMKGNKLTYLHRYLTGAERGQYVDHINHNTLDNRRSNLRICSNGANLRNGSLRPNNKTGHTGVYYFKKQPIRPWVAKIRVNYKYEHLGSFINYTDAVMAREIAERKYWNV
jgi:hypothetical protein